MMAMPNSLPSRQAQARGFILIYVAGILLFLSATVMGMAVALRLDTQVLLRQKENLQSEYRLEAGLQYTLAQLAKSAAIEGTASIDVQEKARMGGWKAGGGLYQAEIGGGTVTFLIEDAGGALDLNTLSEEEWKRYFTALSIGTAEEAGLWARRMLEAKALAKQAGGATGFASIDDVLALDTIPAAARYGRAADSGDAATGAGGAASVADAGTPSTAPSSGTPAATGKSGGYSGQVPGMRELFSVGTGMRQLEVNRSALPLFAAMTTASVDQLVKFEQARQAKPLTVPEAVQLLGESARPVLYAGKSPLLRLRLETDAGPGRLGMAVLLKSESNNYNVAEKRLAPVALGASVFDVKLQPPPMEGATAPATAAAPPAAPGLAAPKQP
jgi:hypothetical protein